MPFLKKQQRWNPRTSTKDAVFEETTKMESSDLYTLSTEDAVLAKAAELGSSDLN